MTHPKTRTLRANWLVLAVLLLGATIRFSGLYGTRQMLWLDEGYYGLDAASLLDFPRLTPFFPANLGRESGWMYYLAPFVAALGKTPFALHLASTFMGVLTIAAVYRLAKALLPQGAAWAALAMAVLYWPIHVSALGMRVGMFPCVGALALAFLLEAYRDRDRDHDRERPRNHARWLLAGVATGVLAYTYFSARGWIAYAALTVALMMLREPKVRVKGTIYLAVVALIALPLGLYTIQNPDASLRRIEMIADFNPASIMANAGAWLAGLFVYGDQDWMNNIPGRPILDPFVGILAVVGLGAIIFAPGRMFHARWQALWLMGLGLISLAPSLFSSSAPHSLRGFGFSVVLAIVIAVGAQATVIAGRALALRQHHRPALSSWLARTAPLLPALMLIGAGIISTGDWHARWLAAPIRYYSMRQHINQAADFVKDGASAFPSAPLFFTPMRPEFDGSVDAVLRFRAADLSPRHVGAVNSAECLVLPQEPALYAALTSMDAAFLPNMQSWADVAPLHTFVRVANSVTTYTQTLFAVTPKAEVPASSARNLVILKDAAGDVFEMRLVGLPDSIRAGDMLSFSLHLKPLRPLATDYRFTTSLHDAANGVEGRNIWSSQDGAVCSPYPSSEWGASERVIRYIGMPVPKDTPAGAYRLVTRIYTGVPFEGVVNLTVNGDGATDALTSRDGFYAVDLALQSERAQLSDVVRDDAIIDADGYLKQWRLIGGFPGARLGDDVLPGGEANYRAHTNEPDSRLIRSKSRKIDLARFMRPAENTAGYAFTWVYSPEDREGLLGLFSDDGIAVWLNGEEVWRNDVSRYVPDDVTDVDVPKVRLRQGWNALLVKVAQIQGEWAFKARLRQADGSVMTDIAIAAQP